MARMMMMSRPQYQTLAAFAAYGGVMIPLDERVRRSCRHLVKKKLLRIQSLRENESRNSDRKVMRIGYRVTHEGRMAAGVKS